MSTAPAAEHPDGGGSRRALQERIAAFDRRVDLRLEPWRARPAIGRLFRIATIAGDFSLVWQVLGISAGLGIDGHGWHVLWFEVLVLSESLVVNQGVKRLFRRTRPTITGDDRFQVRKPRSSSFPSGHASSAMFAATLLSAWIGWATAPIWYLIASVVAVSRAFVRIHHPSDVVAGEAFGLGLGVLALLCGAGRLLGA